MKWRKGYAHIYIYSCSLRASVKLSPSTVKVYNMVVVVEMVVERHWGILTVAQMLAMKDVRRH